MNGQPASDGVAAEERRLLVLAPRGRDAAVVLHVLGAQGLACENCETLHDMLRRMRAGAGLALLTEEALLEPGLPDLTAWLGEQPPWSDFPFIVLASRNAGRRTEQGTDTLRRLLNVVLLERPLNAQTLVSAARSALRSRLRQYVARRQFDAQQQLLLDNQRLLQAERLASSEALAAREALTLAVDAAELGTFHCPMPLGRIEWNATCKRHFWLREDAQVDIDSFYRYLHPDDLERTRAAVEAAVFEGRPYDIEYRTVSPTGTHRWLRAKGRAFHDESGQVSRFDGVTLDVTRQKQMEAERERMLRAERHARAEAEHASRSKDQFLATLSHELRTPLGAILGWVAILRRRAGDPADLQRGIDTIDRNARAQSRLIDELLDMSRIIAGNVVLEQERLMPAPVVQAVLASLQPSIDAKGLTVQSDIDGEAGPVSADPHRLQQIVWNLVSNAIKFTPQGGTLSVALHRQGRQVELWVRDSGDGIAPDFLPFVFDRFRQADGSSTRRHGGLGLGLAIVRQLVELHGGSVQAHSRGLGHGSAFRVELPVASETSAEAATAPAGQPATGSTPAPAPVPPGLEPGLRVLLVDDDADGREVAARTLEEAGARVDQAGSAAEALELLQRAGRSAHAVLVSDIAMPEVDGYELLTRLRRGGHRLPAIALTAFARPEDRQQALDTGFALHLVKPIDPARLVQGVRQVLGLGARLAMDAGSDASPV